MELTARKKEILKVVTERYIDAAEPVSSKYIAQDDMSPAQRAEIALHPVTLLCCLGQVEVAGVFQVRTLVEVTLERAA